MGPVDRSDSLDGRAEETGMAWAKEVRRARGCRDSGGNITLHALVMFPLIAGGRETR